MRLSLLSLRAELNELSGYEVIKFADDGLEVRADLTELQKRSDPGEAVLGVYVGSIYLCPISYCGKLAKLVLAHEIGHAFGLRHADTPGLMQSTPYWACVTTEAKCLYSALLAR